jgi:hypothetical protein
VSESEIKKLKNKKWERERESEREGDKKIKTWEREKETEKEGELKFFFSLKRDEKGKKDKNQKMTFL